MLDNAVACHKAGAGRLPDGLIVNEIGEIFWENGSDSAAAEEKLVQLAQQGTSGTPDVQWVAYRFLSDERAPRRTEAALAAIRLYEAK